MMQAVVRVGLWGVAGEGGLYLASRLIQQWVPFLDYWEVIKYERWRLSARNWSLGICFSNV